MQNVRVFFEKRIKKYTPSLVWTEKGCSYGCNYENNLKYLIFMEISVFKREIVLMALLIVGIVEKFENGVVYTVEGKSGDMCRARQYSVGSSVIFGYGIPAY